MCVRALLIRYKRLYAFFPTVKCFALSLRLREVCRLRPVWEFFSETYLIFVTHKMCYRDSKLKLTNINFCPMLHWG